MHLTTKKKALSADKKNLLHVHVNTGHTPYNGL